MRVLGIDPGSRLMGYGVVEQREGRDLHVCHGVLKVDPDATLESRLHTLFEGLDAILSRYRPDAVAVEGVFTMKNARSALILGHARGVALLAASRAGLPVHEYAPSKVKRAVGAGGADGKDAVARMVARLLAMPEVVEAKADATDALAIAICHLSHAKVGARLSATASSSSPPSRGKSRSARAFSHLADRLAPAYQRNGDT
ncbi:MAG TPA: crossover junction endodeoxyribonuclease RuvC [Myxococcaceae bacterium]|nr:crossover junction endodeoxyribonuclease RuvC [Myxococcaceae bacterium]